MLSGFICEEVIAGLYPPKERFQRRVTEGPNSPLCIVTLADIYRSIFGQAFVQH